MMFSVKNVWLIEISLKYGVLSIRYKKNYEAKAIFSPSPL